MAKFGQGDLFINRENRTGVSVRSGEPIADVRDLPPYKLEIWAFGNDHEASIFIAGLEAAGTGNAIVHDRNLGSIDTNRIVIVGRMDQEVAADAPFDERVSMMGVERINADSDSIRLTNERNSQEWRAAAERELAEMHAVMDAIGAAPDYAARWGKQWARVGKDRDESFSINWKSVTGPFELTASLEELAQGFLDVRPQMEAMAAQYGCEIDDAWELSFKDPIEDAYALRAAIAVLRGLVKDFHEERARLYREDFVARTKMTAKWAKMIIAGRETGIRTTTVRRMERASIDGADIGRTDIHTLLSVGWVERGGAGLMPTSAGLEAAATKLGKNMTPKNN